MADRCAVCFDNFKKERHGVYKKIADKVHLLYEACPKCHGRIVRDSLDFGNPEWPKKQEVLKAEYHGKTPLKVAVKKPKKKESVGHPKRSRRSSK